MRAWWLYKKQPDPDSTVPVVMIVFLYVIAVGPRDPGSNLA